MKTTLYLLTAVLLALPGLPTAQARSLHHPFMYHHHSPYPIRRYPLLHHPGVYVHHGPYTTRYHHR